MFYEGKGRIAVGAPGLQWYAWSDDDGKTFTDLMPWHFDDGEIIYSPASISQIVKDDQTGKHYWIGNITDYHVEANYPRSTLVIVELDEKYGTAVKNSLTIIDKQHENEPYEIQLSNFNILKNRVRHKVLELCVSA